MLTCIDSGTFPDFANRPLPPMHGLSILDFVVLLTYLAGLIGIGFYFGRKETTTSDFFLAGQRIPWWAAGLSIFGTQLSAITFMAIPAKTYAEDWVYFLAQICIILIAPVVVYGFLPFFRRLNITTAYEYLEQRFNLAVRWFGSLSFILFQFGRMGIVLALPAIALATVTGLNVYLCILIMGVIATFYTTLGGIEAVIWSDVLQVVVLLGGALISLILISTSVDGGLTAVIKQGQAAGKFHMLNWTWDATTTAVWVILGGNFLAMIVPYGTDQSVIQRYLTTRTETAAACSIWTNALLTLPASLLFFFVGTALFVFYQTHPDALTPELATDAIFPWFIANELPVGIAGLVIAALFAASMSSVDSSMNSIATSVITDFYLRLVPASTDTHRLKLAKRLTIGLGVMGTTMALLIATFEVKSLWDLFLQIVGLFGGSLAGVFLLGLFTTRAHATGTLCGAIIGATVLFFVQQFTNLHFFLYAGIGILSCFITGYLLSLILPKQTKSLQNLTVYTR